MIEFLDPASKSRKLRTKWKKEGAEWKSWRPLSSSRKKLADWNSGKTWYETFQSFFFLRELSKTSFVFYLHVPSLPLHKLAEECFNTDRLTALSRISVSHTRSLSHPHTHTHTHTHTHPLTLPHSHAFYLASHSLCLSVSIRLSTHNFSFPLTSSTYAASVSSSGIPVSSLSLSLSLSVSWSLL